MAEFPKSKSTGGRYHAEWSPCRSLANKLTAYNFDPAFVIAQTSLMEGPNAAHKFEMSTEPILAST